MRARSLFLLLPFLHLLGCERPGLVAPPERGFPVRWTLTDVEGRRLEATLIGRSADAVSLVRDVDGKRYELPLARLAAADRARVEALPIQPAPFEPGPASRPARPMAAAKAAPESGVLRLRRAALEEKQSEAEALRAQFTAATGKIEQRTLTSRIERLEKEIAALQAEIESLEAPVGLSR